MVFASSTRMLSAIRQNPLILNGVIGGALCASSDVMAQHLEQQEQQQQKVSSSSSFVKNDSHLASSPFSSSSFTFRGIDWFRCGSAGMIGTFFGGIVYPRAYAKLDAIWVGTHFMTILQKSLVEIATVGIFVNSLSMTIRGFCKQWNNNGCGGGGNDDDDISIDDKNTDDNMLFDSSRVVFQHVASELPTVTRNDFVVWLPYNLVAFSVIPPVIRPTTTAIMEASWQTYISLRANNNK